jgi:hypothetical protein
MLGAAIAFAMQTTVIAAPSPVTDEALTALALQESPLNGWMTNAIVDDPTMRAEVQRVGFDAGCSAIMETQASIVADYRDRLAPKMVAAIRDIVPTVTLDQMKILSFFVGPMQVYKSRVYDRVLEDALAVEAADKMRAAFLARTGQLPTTQDPGANRIAPNADIGQALGINGLYDLDNPAHLSLACAESKLSPDQRPKVFKGN